MHQLQARLVRAESTRISWVPPLKRIVALFAGILDRRARTEHEIAARYECHSWGDSTERKMNDDIANLRW
jgi:hypothetical protein